MIPAASDIRYDQSFFGREEELFRLLNNLTCGRHTLITGPKGVGKSRLMLEAKKILSGRARRIEIASQVQPVRSPPESVPGRSFAILTVDHFSPLGECLKEIAEQLHGAGDLGVDAADERGDFAALRKQMAGLGNAGLQAAILEGVMRSEKPYLIFFDSLDRISPVYQPFLESLLALTVVCASVVQIKDVFVYRRIWASFEKISLDALPEPDCSRLIDHILVNYPVRVSDQELYRRELLKASDGNPFYIKNLMWHGKQQGNLTEDEIRALRRAEEGPFFNMGPLYIFTAGALTLFKIFSFGTDNREFYIYFSALGFLIYLTFRIFRNFFLFRPQKNK
ncbi:MAG TPA: AAA family ATPase [Bacteroidota bacterium]|nr:AAA family ATPase [Bacteroidota bacterium]